MSIANMTSKGRITVPRNVRSELTLVPGSRLQFIPDGTGGFIVTRERVRLRKPGHFALARTGIRFPVRASAQSPVQREAARRS
ncbi:MAG TPA: AbrB/MazE/SpoVT family DNA-binding domain-containing protein [Microbacteriaceae bacterium]